MEVAQPLVSVLMTAYNRENYIGAAIESVLNSDYRFFELIIVDDCSKDNTVKLVEQYAQDNPQIKLYVNEKNLGDYPNRNKAASYANGKYIKYLDSDDVMYPHCLTVMIGAMEQFPEAGYGLSSIGDPFSPYPLCISPHQAYIEHFYGYGHFDRAPGSSIIKLEAFNAVGGFSGKRMIGDYELWMKMGMYYPLVKFQVDLYWARQHQSQESQSEYAKQYHALRKSVLSNAFNSKDCPLSVFEQEKILKKAFRKQFFNKILNKLH